MTRRPRALLRASLLCVAFAFLAWVAAFLVPRGARADSAVLAGFEGLRRPRTVEASGWIAGLMDPLPFLGFAAVLIGAAYRRGGGPVALAALTILGGANVTAQVLKPLVGLLPDAHAPDSLAASWPSGHTSAAMSLALCLVLAVPSRWRPPAGALAALGVVAVVYSILLLGWHYPSDVVGAFLITAAWGLAVLAMLRTRRAPEGPAEPADALWPPGIAAGCVAIVAGAAMVARPETALNYAQAHTTFVVGAASVGAAAIALAAWVAALARG